MPNIFRQALNLLDKKDRTQREEELLAAASIPLDILPECNELTTQEGLKKLSEIVREEKHGRQLSKNHSQ